MPGNVNHALLISNDFSPCCSCVRQEVV